MTIDCGNYGIFLTVGHARFISSTVRTLMVRVFNLARTKPAMQVNFEEQLTTTPGFRKGM